MRFLRFAGIVTALSLAACSRQDSQRDTVAEPMRPLETGVESARSVASPSTNESADRKPALRSESAAARATTGGGDHIQDRVPRDLAAELPEEGYGGMMGMGGVVTGGSADYGMEMMMPGSEPAVGGMVGGYGMAGMMGGDSGMAGMMPDPYGPTYRGAGYTGDRYDNAGENPFRSVTDHPLSTFSVDVDTASYANVRRFLLREGRLPPPDSVRIEELINYFNYDYSSPADNTPFTADVEVARCPWKPGHRLVRIGLKGKQVRSEERPRCNLVFLLDVSGSMRSPDKLPLLKRGMQLLVEQLRENDRVAVVVYAGSEGLVLPSTPGRERNKISDALERLEAGGSTNGGAGIELAYRIANDNFIPDGVNRVLLCTDGDFNVGVTSTGDLVRRIEEHARSGVFLSVLGFGRGNLNDAMMETISNKGNGNYSYIDSIVEARKVLATQVGGTLVTICKDVKLQVEFNPVHVRSWRLIGYENRMLTAEDFNDDRKDAGEIGAGHTVTALYELVPIGSSSDVADVDPLRYQTVATPVTDESLRRELLTLKVRYKLPDEEKSKRLEFPVSENGQPFGKASTDFQFAAAVAAFGLLLRHSEHQGEASYDAALEIAEAAKGPDVHGYRAELLEMIRCARAIVGN